ncbi:3-phosphoshikimate 1-carboxyvinyltransferase : 3-phosphoshikimate 1-carboxyvinyltransferase OS=Singulisphaera acidiphila (strain ATCC BAA-1392 / DSM 18658 / VKM B-2454 / MOB10) GN=aroA PE=3 SV=1: EPSP_synthase [Gemmataceae bacterium]|nr:3-phosphoshikimate 1-carboxyvinyltransferase : 3-phosphoshikimate 1-carboxyvinyltransferase OS=Singulisphaera acidiphila (strain ATCC BAA-1392 / DSM 18658 / VKM B-2454 / MOB10) GN=aroA PE=3 SV=1: EPSP_synthase [Gemmataceae bacterium]VTT99756.1 3-phosphoshikimate 1-carboxyvinyltransferase : 3-phosphoshikimate 1-carboxyvinyltransferase OS=Singulisphaera acidiphila (strain ATCC BAA-1392 / DSM 18658 / VKM B-2454 / MOB10) GN=aroA PE=3 SV=1: EPSP_synthase [Gemmataceae bacterium]
MSEHTYPPELAVAPLTAVPSLTVTVPGSKSITNRALVLAALSNSTSRGCSLTGALRSEDTEVMLDCLIRLGFEVQADWPKHTVRVRRGGSADFVPDDEWIPNGQAELFVGNSGTTIRFLTAMLALGEGTYRLDGIPRMRERPIRDLLDALTQLGVDARSEFDNGCPPVLVNARGLNGGRVRIKADVSSQFLSGLMLACPFARGDTLVEIEGTLVSEPYVEMTVGVLQAFGLKLTAEGPGRYLIPGGQRHNLTGYDIEPDASSASYFLAAAAITGGIIAVDRLTMNSLQGDVRFLDLLVDMGCTALRGRDCIAVTGGPLRGIDVDMNDISDTVMTLGAVACFAEGPTTIRNVGHIRHKETDRIAALATELRKLGAKVEERDDGLTITPGPLRGCAVDTYNDHRMAMSLALVGLKVPGVVVRNPGCVAKTYPGFWTDLDALRRPPA